MKAQAAIQKILWSRFQSLQAKNPRFSVRAFAKKAGVSPGTLSLILLGKRNVSRKLAARMAEKLLLDPQERSELLRAFPDRRPSRANGTDSVDPAYLQLTADQFHIVGEWHHFAILNLLALKDFRNDPAWIAGRLGLPKGTVEVSLERLKRLEMIKESATGRLSRAQPRYRTTDDVASLSLRKSHHQTLELAKESLESDPIDRRDFTWLTLPIDTRKLPLAKTMIRKFQDELLSAVQEGGQPDEVYRLSVQLFPLTKGRNP